MVHTCSPVMFQDEHVRRNRSRDLREYLIGDQRKCPEWTLSPPQPSHLSGAWVSRVAQKALDARDNLAEGLGGFNSQTTCYLGNLMLPLSSPPSPWKSRPLPMLETAILLSETGIARTHDQLFLRFYGSSLKWSPQSNFLGPNKNRKMKKKITKTIKQEKKKKPSTGKQKSRTLWKSYVIIG